MSTIRSSIFLRMYSSTFPPVLLLALYYLHLPLSTGDSDSTVVIIEDERDGATGCMACLSKMVKVMEGLLGGDIIDETDDWEFLSMYWWSRYYAMEGWRTI